MQKSLLLMLTSFLFFPLFAQAQDSLKIEKGSSCWANLFVWDIDIYKRTILPKEKTITTKIEKTESLLKETTNEDKRKELLAQLSDLKNDWKLIKVSGKRIGGEFLSGFYIDMCDKYIPTEKEEPFYWGLTGVKTPNDKIETDAGGISVFFSTKVEEIAFQDKITIQLRIVRNALNEQIKEKTIHTTWTLQLQCNNDDRSKVAFVFSPENADDLLAELNHDEGITGLYYDINLKEMQQKLVEFSSDIIAKRSKH